MQIKILFNRNLSVEQRIKRYVIYLFLRYKAWRGWYRRFKKAFSLNLNLKKRDIKEAEKEHNDIWKDFRINVNMNTYRMCKNISGISNPYIVPEEVYLTDLQTSLNIYPERSFLEIKSIYNKWYSNDIFPKDYFHNLDGVLLNHKLIPISIEERDIIIDNINYPVVFKPNIQTNGGKGISLIKSVSELSSHIENKKNYIVQEVIKQNSFFSKFCPDSSNTIRVFLYRSVKDNNIHVLGMAMKTGRNGQFADNEAVAGLVSYIDDGGALSHYALDKYGKKYTQHPDTGVRYEGKIPKYQELKELSISVAKRLFFSRIIGLDVSLDSESNWKIIEINLGTQSIRFSQYAGQPFFGKFSKEVIEYCKVNHWATKNEI